ncbi:MAG: hypothetical protein JNK78_15435 [Planctomycetes bacterium]|nr:hypothetical protein [Planctomycetota bacterium]
MKTKISVLLISSLAFVACGKQPVSAPSGGSAAQQPMPHDDHDTQPIGDLTVGAHTFTVKAAAVEAGKEVPLDLEFAAGKPIPGTARAWIGVENGTGSMKAKLTKEGDHTLHNHLLAPKPLPEGSKIWVEIEDGTNVARGSIAWK